MAQEIHPFLNIQLSSQVYPNMRSAFVDIFQTRGIRGVYAGLTPTLVEIVPYAGLQFGTYDTFKRWAMVSFIFSSLSIARLHTPTHTCQDV